MSIRENWHKIIRQLAYDQPWDATDEEWDCVLEERRAEEKRRDDLIHYAVDHYKETPEYRSAGWFRRLVMRIDYEVFLDKRGEIGRSSPDHDLRTQALLDELGDEAEALARMTHEERLAYFRHMKRFRDLTFDVDCDATILHVTTSFEGVTDETVAEAVRRTAGEAHV